MLEQLIEDWLPIIISMLDIFGIFVVAVSAVRAFYHYLCGMFSKDARYDVKFELAGGMATGLEFKMAAEILKTVLVHTVDELLVLGAIILLRALLSFIIHVEMRADGQKKAMESDSVLEKNK